MLLFLFQLVNRRTEHGGDEVRRGQTRVLGTSVLVRLRKGQEVDERDVGHLKYPRWRKGKKENSQTRPGSLTVRVDNPFAATQGRGRRD
jgi:hypothetical protein